MADRTFIYALADPRTGVIRYVGKADNPWRRLQRHVWEAQTKRPTAKRTWLRELEPYGGPVLHVLEEVADSEWLDREAAWIALGHRYGWGLTNVLDSGRDRRGFAGHHHTPETRERQAAYWRGRTRAPLSNEHRQKIGEARRGRLLGQQSEAHRRKLGAAVRAAGAVAKRQRGEGNLKAKLTVDDVRAIRAARTTRRGAAPALARRHGVRPNTIYRIWSGETWGHLQ